MELCLMILLLKICSFVASLESKITTPICEICKCSDPTTSINCLTYNTLSMHSNPYTKVSFPINKLSLKKRKNKLELFSVKNL